MAIQTLGNRRVGDSNLSIYFFLILLIRRRTHVSLTAFDFWSRENSV